MFLRSLRSARHPSRTNSQRRPRLNVEQLEPRCQPAALTYASYLGGDVSDGVTAVATDSVGDIYLAGRTNSDTFPGFVGTKSPFANGFVVKFDPTGTTLLWTALLESNTDGIRGLAVDTAGNAYVTGETGVLSGFATTGAAQTAYGGNEDAFAVKLNGATGATVWATYLGGNQLDDGQAIAVNAQGVAIVTGYTTSPNFPTHNPLTGQGALHIDSGEDAFVTAISADGAHFLFSTYLGGNQDQPGDNGATVSMANAITLDKAGNVYLTGNTVAADFPTVNPFQTSGSGQDVFITELAADFSQIVYSTYLHGQGIVDGEGGDGDDIGYGLAVDGEGNVLVTGSTTSLGLPTKKAFQASLDRGSPALEDAFVTKLNPTKTGSAQLVYSTYDGGHAIDFGQAITVDAAGNAYLAGFSNSDTLLGKFPVVHPFQKRQDPGTAFIAEFSPAGHIVFNSKYGAAGSGYTGGVPLGAVITATPFGRVIFAGDSGSNRLLTTANAFQKDFPDATDSGYFAMLTSTPVKSFRGVDADGDFFTVSLSGPGGINVIGTGPISTIAVQNTNPASSVLTIRVTKKVGDGFVDVGSITGSGLARITASSARLVGSGIDLTGPLGALVIHDLTDTTVEAIRIGALTVAGTFTASNVTAGSIGTVKLATVATDNGGHAFGITAQTKLTKLTVTSPKFAYNPRGSATQSIGDFTVTVQ